MVNAGRVGLVPKGEWNATTQYEKLDIVSYQNKGYIGSADNIPIGTLPTDSNYFMESFSIDGFVSEEEFTNVISTINARFNYSGSQAVEIGSWGSGTKVYRQTFSRTFQKTTNELTLATLPAKEKIMSINDINNFSNDRYIINYSAMVVDCSEDITAGNLNESCELNKNVSVNQKIEKSPISYTQYKRTITPSIVFKNVDSKQGTIVGYVEYIL